MRGVGTAASPSAAARRGLGGVRRAWRAIDPIMLPAPSRVLGALWEFRGSAVGHLVPTVVEAIVGFALVRGRRHRRSRSTLDRAGPSGGRSAPRHQPDDPDRGDRAAVRDLVRVRAAAEGPRSSCWSRSSRSRSPCSTGSAGSADGDGPDADPGRDRPARCSGSCAGRRRCRRSSRGCGSRSCTRSSAPSSASTSGARGPRHLDEAVAEQRSGRTSSSWRSC